MSTIHDDGLHHTIEDYLAGRLKPGDRLLCPFHDDHRPSAKVLPGKERFWCLGAETMVITMNGTASIRELAGTAPRLLMPDGSFAVAPISSFGEQELWRVHLSRNGITKVIRATPEHRWLVRGRLDPIYTTRELRARHRLAFAFPRPVSLPVPTAEAIRRGFIFGDGTRNSRRTSSLAILQEGAKLAALRSYFAGMSIVGPYAGQYKVHGFPLAYKDLPVGASPDELYGWLMGYFAADGCVSKEGHATIASASRDALEFVRYAAQVVGIGTYGIKRQIRRGRGQTDTPLYSVCLRGSCLTPGFFLLEHHRERFVAAGPKRERPGWLVVGVEPTGEREEVFCATVPGFAAFTLADNLVTGNCFTCAFSDDRLGVAMRLLFPDRWQEKRPADFIAARDWLELGGSWLTLRRSAPPEPPAIDPFVYDLMARFCELATRQLATQPAVIAQLRETRGLQNPVKLGLGLGHWSLLGQLERELGSDPGWTEANLIQAGLCSPPRGERPARYRLADRLILPEWRPSPWGRGETVAFYQARARDDGPKYLNPPIPRQLYGAHTLTRATRFVWVGEGAFDVLPLIEAGAAAIATLGTHLAEAGLENLAAIAGGRTVLLAFDNDPPSDGFPLGAGRTQGLRLQQRLRAAGIATELVTVPERYKDLGEWLATQGARAVMATICLTL